MRILVTGAAGHLGEALMRMARADGHDPVGLDIRKTAFVDHVGSVTDAGLVARAMAGAEAVLHAATLHKPHMATHSKQDFVEVNVTGTLTLLEAAAAAGVRRFVYTSTTSAFGEALRPAPGAPAAWIDEDVTAPSKNIYGATKRAAEDLCRLFVGKGDRATGMGCVVLRTSRFFPEDDDAKAVRDAYAPENAKANEYLYRRVDLGDAARAHFLAAEAAPDLGFRLFVISATSPFGPGDLAAIRDDAEAAVAARFPGFRDIYEAAGYRMTPSLDRIYANDRARAELGWRPDYDFARVLAQIEMGAPIGGALARTVGRKGYHETIFTDGPYPVE